MQLKLTVEYEGTRYQGWQRQPAAPRVQGVLGRALAPAVREPVRVRGAGRTDAGVHACGQVAAVKVTCVPADLGRLRKSLNALTPEDVAVREIAVVDDAFDPRRQARSRVYEYRILNAPAPSPFWRRHAWHVPEPLDVVAMDEVAAELVGEHDFAAFRGADAEPVRSTVRRVLESHVHAGPALWHSPCYSTSAVVWGSAGRGLLGPGAAPAPGAQALADLALAAAVGRLVVAAGAEGLGQIVLLHDGVLVVVGVEVASAVTE